ncbi:MAG: hypothetical protein GXP31_16810 [Kiritimatiellaeota bacterium]|nr:hypothetical protein [Kiritimatiellota bacterium]
MPETNLEQRLANLEQELSRLRAEFAERRPEDLVCIICFSGEWDKVFAALTLATSALALGSEVHVFCTFWGASLLRGGPATPCRSHKRPWPQRLLDLLMPKSIEDLPLSRMNFFGIGRRMLRSMMKKKGVADLTTLMAEARELGVHFHVCDTSVSLFGWSDAEIGRIPGCDRCGAATFLALALKSRAVFFI